MDFGLFSSFSYYHQSQGISKKAIRLDIMTRKELIYVRSWLHPRISSSRAHHEEEEEAFTVKTRQKTGHDSGQRIQDKGSVTSNCRIRLRSNIEPDYEDFLSDDEDYEEERPVLKRSESSESVFANIYMTDNFFDKVSGFYRQKINPVVHPTSTKRNTAAGEWILDSSFLFATTTEVKKTPRKAIRSDIMTRKELIYVRSRLHPRISSSRAHNEEEEAFTVNTRKKTGHDSGQKAQKARLQFAVSSFGILDDADYLGPGVMEHSQEKMDAEEDGGEAGEVEDQGGGSTKWAMTRSPIPKKKDQFNPMGPGPSTSTAQGCQNWDLEASESEARDTKPIKLNPGWRYFMVNGKLASFWSGDDQFTLGSFRETQRQKRPRMANQEEEEKLQELSEPKKRNTRGARCRKEAVGVRKQPENASGVARQRSADPEGVRGQRRGSRAGERSRNPNELRIPAARANPEARIAAEAPKTDVSEKGLRFFDKFFPNKTCYSFECTEPLRGGRDQQTQVWLIQYQTTSLKRGLTIIRIFLEFLLHEIRKVSFLIFLKVNRLVQAQLDAHLAPGSASFTPTTSASATLGPLVDVSSSSAASTVQQVNQPRGVFNSPPSEAHLAPGTSSDLFNL
ncbi:hypothetical protein B9Z55_027983 [Caenorhabditis nigoni]|uniref:Uncharacterized protein n=1 Tax=Caenorhabditis nigoni TaxID=1611254 RepID=A0A2G5SDF6_9PELO|nr:hypothetical protein B9Z55_027983 [Caenorhabditis nigoni]